MNTVDIIKTIFVADNSPLMSAMSQLEKKAAIFQSRMGKTTNIDKLNSQLKKVGLELRKNGSIKLRGERTVISQANAMKRITTHAKEEARAVAQSLSLRKQIARMQQVTAAKRTARLAEPVGMEDMQRFQKMGMQMGQFSRQGINVNKQLDEMRTRLKGSKVDLNALNKGFMRGRQAFNMFNLSLMFGGMILQRAGMTVMRFMVPAMDKLEKLNSKGAKEIMGMTAALEFMKISIFETLSQTGLFKAFTEGFVKLAIWVSELVQKYPTITAIVAAFALLAIGVGTTGLIFSKIGNVGTMFKGSWAIIQDWIGANGTGGIIGKAFKKFKTFASKLFNLKTLGVGLNLALLGFSVNELIKAIKKKDIGGMLGFGIASAFALGGAITALFNPAVGILLAIPAAIAFTFTKITADTRQAHDMLREELGMDKLNMFQSLAAGGNRGDIQDLIDTQGLQLVKDKYLSFTQQLKSAQEELTLAENQGNINVIPGLTKKITAIQENINKYVNMGLVFDSVASSESEKFITFMNSNQSQQQSINNVLTKMEEEDAAIKAIKDTHAEVTPEIIQNYADMYAKQLTTDEGLESLKTRMVEFGAVVNTVIGQGGEKSSGVIGNFYNFGKEIMLDNAYFITLKTDIDTWASVVTKKTVEITYVHKDSGTDNGSGNEGFFETTGKFVDEGINSMTGKKVEVLIP